jgi:spore coat protein U-like protein
MQKRNMILSAALILGVLGMAFSGYAVITTLTIHSTGNMSMIQAFYDQACTSKVTTIDWGNIYPNNQTIVLNQTVWVKNFGTKTVTLNLTTSNWSPADANLYMTVGWDREADTLAGGQVLSANITLTISANIINSDVGSFSFDIQINEAW